MSFPGVGGRDRLADVADTVTAPLGSARHPEHDTVSGMLAAMGVGAARGAVRLSVGRSARMDHIDRTATALAASWARLRGH